MATHPRKLLDQVRDTMRRRHYAQRTEDAYCHWIRRFILFHNKRHPREPGGPEIESFLAYLAVLSPDEVWAIMDTLSGSPRLVVPLLYGSGLRISECIRLRVKDSVFEHQRIIVRNGKGAKDRATLLPIRCSRPPSAQILNLALPAASAPIAAWLPGRQGADHKDHRRAISPFR